MAQKLQQQLKEVGSKLQNPPTSKDALIKLLKQAASYLSEVEQSPLSSVMESMQPCLKAIAKTEFLKHQDKDVKILVAACICEITRITAPDAPYNDDTLTDIFRLIVSTFGGLGDIHAPSFGRRVVILETLARYRSCVVILDLECDELVAEMFRTFFSVVRDDHPESVVTSMQTIMTLLINESEDIKENILYSILSVLGRKHNDVPWIARKLAMNVIEHCVGKLEPYILQVLISSMSGGNSTLNFQLDSHEIIFDIYQCAPSILTGIIPYITGELLTDKLDVRLEGVKLLGDLFSLPNCSIFEGFRPLFLEFLKRLTDRVVDVRISVIEHVKNCLLSNPNRLESSEIIGALCARLLDYDENVRKEVIAAIFDVACHSIKAIPFETIKLVAERLRDKSLLVKRYAMERLAELYNLYCLRFSEGLISTKEFDWVPGKILRCCYDKDFRPETIEASLSPANFPVKDKVKHWVSVLSEFDRVDIKALEKILGQKQRLQEEMQKYLSLRQMYQESDTPELQRRILGRLRTMSLLFNEPIKAEESFHLLNQLKDANIWKILTNLLNPYTGLQQSWALRDELLKILGDKHPLYDFTDTLSMKCSYLLFNREHVKQILLEASELKNAGNTKLIQACMHLLAVLSSFSPFLLNGVEEDLVLLLKDENEEIKEGIAHVLAKAGGTIREQLATTSSSVDLLLERLCLEGSRKQAKYSVHALAAITKDDGLKSLSVLYKRLVDMLVENTHLPSILQSLGCIAQCAMPVFETRETEIVEFITNNILCCINKPEDEDKISWDERSEACLLKIYGIKALTKSYLPVKDAQLRTGIENLLKILGSILSYGEISKDINSSAVDKAHLRLASAKSVLRLSKYWDHKIPVDIFHLTLRTSQDAYMETRKQFLGKVYQYIRERVLDAKYACAFLFNLAENKPSEIKEGKQYLVDVIQMCYRDGVKARQRAMQCDSSSLVSSPEYILAHLVHALAHTSCPNFEECKEPRECESLYRQLHLLLSLMIGGESSGQSKVEPIKDHDIASSIFSVLQTIKSSEDAVDALKSKNSYVLCDLGISITQRLVPDGTTFTEFLAPLPQSLYNQLGKDVSNKYRVNGEHTCLTGESICAYFESLKSKIGKEDDLDEAEKENTISDNEIPLGKIMKSLKSQSKKNKKTLKRCTSTPGKIFSENDFDIMGMVRKINLDNLRSTQDSEHALDVEKVKVDTVDKMNKKKTATKMKRKKSKDTILMPFSKYKSSPFSQNSRKRKSPSSSEKDRRNVSDIEADEMDVDHHDSKKIKSKPKITTVSLNKNSSKKRKMSALIFKNMNEGEDFGSLVKKSIVLESTNKTSSGKVKQLKRTSAELAKPSFQESFGANQDLIGCRIKVWWPLDKEFYEGTVQSYDPVKRKHTVLYDDGDTEVLQLDKEHWMQIQSDFQLQKKLKSEKLFSPKEKASEEKDSKRTSSKKRTTPVKKISEVKSKTSAKSLVKPVQIGKFKNKTDANLKQNVCEDASELSHIQSNAVQEGDEFISDAQEDQITLIVGVDQIEDGQKGKGESNNGRKSHSCELEDAKEESDEDELLSAWKLRAGK